MRSSLHHPKLMVNHVGDQNRAWPAATIIDNSVPREFLTLLRLDPRSCVATRALLRHVHEDDVLAVQIERCIVIEKHLRPLRDDRSRSRRRRCRWHFGRLGQGVVKTSDAELRPGWLVWPSFCKGMIFS